MIVVDDEQSAIDYILTVLAPFVDLVVKKTFTDPLAALGYLRKHHVDFVLLDIDMPVLNGLDFALQMPREIKVIFCTAHREYALESYDYEAVDYLMKSVKKERFNRALGRMKDALKVQAGKVNRIRNDYYYFMLKGMSKFTRTRVDFDELVFVEVRNKMTYFHLIGDLVVENNKLIAAEKTANEGRRTERWTTDGIPCRMNLEDVYTILKDAGFFQVYRSFLLNTAFFRRYTGGIIELKGLDAIKLPTGERKNYPDFFNWVEESNLPDKE